MLAPRFITPGRKTPVGRRAGPSPLRARWLRRTALAVAISLGVLLLAGFFLVPVIVKHEVEQLGSTELAREVRVESVSFNPLTLQARLRGLAIRDEFGPRSLLEVDALVVDLSAKSLLHFAPVVKRVQVTRPAISVIRLAEDRYNFSDIVERQLAKPPKSPARFAVFNLEVVDGRVDFEDRPEKLRHTVTGIALGVPFISSFPVDIDVAVQPKLDAVVNGDPLHIAAQTKPFKDTLETSLDLDYSDIDLARYLAYSPVDLRFRVPSGKLDTKLHVVFATRGGKPATLTVGGTAVLRDLAVQHPDGRLALAAKAISAAIGRAEVIEREVTVTSVRVDALTVNAMRRADGSWNLLDLVPAGPSPAVAGSAAPPRVEKPWAFAIGEIVLTGGRADVEDRMPPRGFRTVLSPIELTVRDLSSVPNAQAQIVMSAVTDFGAKLEHRGTVSVAPLAARGHVSVTRLPIAKLEAYYAPYTTVQVAEGVLDAATDYVAAEAGAIAPRFDNLSLTLGQVRIMTPGVKEPLWRVPRIALNEGTVDVAKRRIVIGDATLTNAVGYVLRTPDGKTQYDTIARTSNAPAPRPRGAAAPEDAAWSVAASRITLAKAALTFEDRIPARRVVTRIGSLDLTVQGASNAAGADAAVALRGTVNRGGTFDIKGQVSASPVKGRLAVRTRNLSLVPFQPYVDDQIQATLNAGALSNSGTLAFDASPGKPLMLAYTGDVALSDLAAVTKADMQDLLRWKSARAEGVRFTSQPLKADIEAIALENFYARVILDPNGVLNLQQLGTKSAPEVTPVAMPAKAAPVPVAAPQRPDEANAQVAAPANFRFGRITFTNGNVNFSDFYVKPNYSANLTGLTGTVSEMTPVKPGDVALRARIDGAAPVAIDGRVNVLARDLFLDINASAKDIDLPPLSPYSAKYAGYGIQKGKLSMTVKYLIENRTLAAENNIYLDQLTFGDRVESPTATKLPVLLAVALLKDRNGVIDLNLPISGSLDDPQFSVGGLIVRVIVNLITKAVTAPFALIGAAFGGGPELSFVEFDAGSAVLDGAALKRLDALAKALDSRPGLKLEVVGRVDAAPDRAALKAVSLQRKVRAQKLRELSRNDAEGASAETVTVEKAEYEQYLRRAYRAEKFDKPRNVLGLVKDIPVAEMEKLILDNTQVSDEDLRVLANQRAQAAKAFLVDKGHVAGERIFILAPAAGPEGVKEGKSTRADFALKN